MTQWDQEDDILVCELRSGCGLRVGGRWETWWLSCAHQLVLKELLDHPPCSSVIPMRYCFEPPARRPLR